MLGQQSEVIRNLGIKIDCELILQSQIGNVCGIENIPILIMGNLSAASTRFGST